MNRLSRLLSSSIGAKFGMAASGLALGLFLVGHLSGNLLVFAGRDAINSYAEGLANLGPLLWVIRGGLLAVFLLHVVLAIKLSKANRSARPVAYARPGTVQASSASRTMIWTGLLVLAFVLLHLAHFTLGVTDPEGWDQHETVVNAMGTHERHDVYGMIFDGFGSNLYCAIYLASLLVLGFHLSHGFHSLFQSLGIRHSGYTPLIEKGARGLAWVLIAAYSSIPLAIRLGLVKPEGLS